MSFYAQHLYEPINFSLKKQRYFKHIARNLHFYVCPLTIDTRFYPDSKPKETTVRLLKGPKFPTFVAFNARHGLLGPYWFEEAGKTVTVNATTLS